MSEKFEFTYDYITGESKEVLPPINEMIMGIACALEFPESYQGIVYGGNRDEQDDVMEFRLSGEYITRLRHSHEYHDAVMQYLYDTPAHCEFSNPDVRYERYDEFCDLMAEHGVLGRVGLYESEGFDPIDKELMDVSNAAAEVHTKLCNLRDKCIDAVENLPTGLRFSVENDMQRYDKLACDLDNTARGACDTITVNVKE